MTISVARDELLQTLRGMLFDLFTAQGHGMAAAKIARAHGYTDGFMQALLDARVVTQRELLAIVSEERERVAGPATRTLPGVAACARSSA